MKFQKFTCLHMVIIVLVCLVTISAASATDVASSDKISDCDMQELILEEALSEDVSSTDDNDELVLEDSSSNVFGDSSNENAILKEGETAPGSFKDLNKLINEDFSDNDTITLNGNYKYSDGDDDFVHGIWIGRGVTIDGNGFTLDGSNSARMFDVETNSEVIIKNINFINGHATSGTTVNLLSGGAIFFGVDSKYANNKVINCNFTNNTAENDGGAICGIYSGVAINCTFIQNTAKKMYSGALHHFDATNCTFIRNTAKYGGAILDSTAINCTFINNTAQGSGAMLMGAAVLCRFVEDSDTTSDTNIITPAFNVSDLTTVYNSGDKLLFNLTANNVNYDGLDAEIKIYKSETPIKTIHALSGNNNGWLVDLPIGTYNAVLSMESHYDVEPADVTLTVTTDGTTFTDLNELINGNTNATIALDKNYTYNPDIDSDFKNGVKIYRTVTIIGNGYTIDGAGQARILDIQQGKTTLKNITFKNGSQSFFFGGGAIRCVALVEIANCTFINNGAPSGGAVQLQGWDNVISDCVFIANTADRGGAIELSAAAYNTITGCVFYDNDIFGSQANGCEINNNIFINSTIIFDWTQNYNIDDNWFGNNATNYDMKPVDYTINSWLFLNATADSIIISPSDTSDITFKLYKYGSDEVSEYDNTLSKPVNLNITSANGHVNVTAVKLGETIQYTADNLGTGQVTATIENITYTVELNIIKLNPNLSVESQNVTYSENTFIKLNYTSTATGKVNVTLKGKRHDFKFTDLELNTAIVLGSVPVDEYDVNVSYSGDDNFDNATATGTLTITLSYVPHVNVTSLTTTNKTVNITAKSNIPNEIIGGKLLFILPNGTQIEATYGANGTWWAEHTFDTYGEYKVNATYVGLDNVTINNGTITINKVNSTITLDNIVLDYGESTNVTVTTTGATGITAKIDGNDVTVINNYNIQISGLKAGNHTLTVTTIPDDDHNPATATSKITVNKVESTLTVDDIVFDYGSEGSGNVSFAGASEVIANVVSQPSAVVSVNGKKITVSGLAAGTYTLNVTTVPDENHTAVSETATITVNKVNSSLTLDDVELDYGGAVNVTVAAEGATGITAEIDGADVVVDGYTISISDLSAGSHTLAVTAVPDENHTAVTKTATITVNKVSTNLTAAAVTATYKVNKYLIIKLTDGQDNPLANSTVTVDLNGAKNYTTDENGQIKIKVSNMVPKTYSAKISYVGNDNYIGSNVTAKVVVKKATPKITASAKTFKTATKTKKYTITLKDNTGKAIKNAKVTLKVNGKTYKATTNSKGKATFKITKLTKKGTFKATITYTGNKYYNKVTKKANIKVISSWKTISKGSKDKSTVREIQQALKNHGYYLTAYGHYLKVDGIYWDYTVRSVKEFQHDKGLKVTGKVDENTAKKLGLI